VDEREQPAFDEAPRRIASGTDPRRLYAVIAVLLGVIVVLAIRPWGGDAPPPASEVGPRPTGAAAVATPIGPDDSAPSPLPVGAATGLDVTCGSPSGWRAATLQAWAGRDQPIRSWIAIEPVEAAGALDPSVPFAPVATGVVTALGYCAPLGDAERPPAVAVASLWALAGDRAVPLTLLPLEPAAPDALGGLWLRPPEVTDVLGGSSSPGATSSDAPAPSTLSAAAGAALWPPGKYVVELASPGGDYHRWLGIEIAHLAPSQPGSSGAEATPSPAP
jgi:hypothetical protein